MTKGRDRVVELRNQLMSHAIATDAQFAGRFVGSLQQPHVQSVGPVASLCLVSYLSLFAHESYQRLKASQPALAESVSSDTSAIIKRSRHSLKLFEDTERRLTGQLAYFRDEIIDAHKARFLGKTWFWPARFLETDLGLYLYDGIPISSTHAATLALGFEPQALLDKGGSTLVRDTFTECGRYFALLGATVDGHAVSFASSFDHTRLKAKDVRSTRYYTRIFNGASTPEINALLDVFRVSMNFVNSVLPVDSTLDSYQTIFKIQFLTLYQVIRSLDILRQQRRNQLSTASIDAIRSIVDTVESRILTDGQARPFRNTLMHYGPDTRIDLTAADLQAPLYGLVNICFPDHDNASLDTLLTDHIARTARILNDWALLVG